MKRDLNVVTLVGRLTRDPEIKQTSSGVSVCHFSIANNRDYKSNGELIENVNFFNCVAWSGLADIISKYSWKGQVVAVSGELVHRTWENENGEKRSAVEIKVNDFQMLSFRDDNQQQENQEPSFV